MTILITNDDGYKSRGLVVLYRAAKKVFGDDIAVVVPDKLKSSTGMSFTFHKPLRLERIKYEGVPCLALSGTPADCAFMALNHLFLKKITLVLSGVNIGMNVGLDAIYSSGTISAAMFAAIYKIPSIAFSKHVHKENQSGDGAKEMDSITEKLTFILEKIKKNGFPTNVELLNINFPKNVMANTSIKVVKPDRGVFQDLVDVKKDPHGREYYWLYGTLRKDLDKEGDIATLLGGEITVTPLGLSTYDAEQFTKVKSIFYDSKN
jgi:5'-nucleotidase